MRERIFKSGLKSTSFVCLDTKKCEACWECIKVCSSNVIGRINLPWHKHVKLVNSSECVGCMKCVKVCTSNAIAKLPDVIQMETPMKSFIINSGLLFSGFLTVFSGLLIQFQYHIGHHSRDSYSLGFDYSSWSWIHKISSVILSLLAAFHIALHWKWYKTVIEKRLLNRNKEVITLSAIFVVAAITGFIPWIIDLADGNELIRKGFVEFHDKIAVILLIYFILHVVKRLKWFLTSLEKIKKSIL